MSTASSLLQELSEEALWHLEAVCCRFEQAWQTGSRPIPSEFLVGIAGAERLALLRELLRLDVFYRRQAGEVPLHKDYPPGLAEDQSVLREVLGNSPESASSVEPEALGDTVDAPRNRPQEACAVDPLAKATENSSLPDADTPLVGRYRLLRFHAQGGLGEVHVAEDMELGREVALKQMQEEHAADPDSRFRFVLEGEVTGALEHPGVVPVYGRGTQIDGRPFYTMRFIRGETLGAAIGRFHAQAPARFDSMEFRQLLGRFVAVCQAVAYAHSRGVVHRDLKPANVMLGPFGETLVLDWGLAKMLQGVAGGAGAEGPLRLMAAGGAATIGAVGTPAYMSPEQAASRSEDLGPTTDVYGLGATLYEMLTGAAPFQGNLFEVLAKVVAGSWTPPGLVNREIPPALDAVCRKAMALRPQDRYGSALELAKDLEGWLADEPVAAYPEPWGIRLRRWARKHPSQVTGAVVLLATAVIGLTLGTVLLERSKRQAEDSYQIAKQGVHYFLREVSEDVLLDEPGMLPLRLSLLNQALNYYEDFLKIRPDDPEVQQQLAETYRLRGGLIDEFDRLPEGKACLARAVALYDGLLRANPADTDLRFGLARCWLWLAELEVKSGESEAGTETVSRAVELLLALREEEPGRFPILDLLGRCLDLRAKAKASRGDVESALRDNQEALAILHQTLGQNLPQTRQILGGATPLRGVPKYPNLGTVHPDKLRAVHTAWEAWSSMRPIANAFSNRGMLLEATGWTAQSARAYQEAVNHLVYLSELHPCSGRLRHELALALLGAGRAEVELGRPTAGERELRKAIALLEKLGEQDPLVTEYKVSLLRARGFLGECLFARGQHQVAAALLREVVEQGDNLLQGKDRNRPLLADYPWFLCVLGRLEADSGRIEEGLCCCEQSALLQKQALALAPNNPGLRNNLLRTREVLSGLRLRKGEIGHDDRIVEQRQILCERKDLAGGGPLSPRLRGEAGASAAVLAGLLLQAGRTREALEVVEQALPPQEALLRADQERWKEGESRDQPQAPVSGLQLLAGIGPRRAVSPSLQFRSQWAELLAHKGAALAATSRGATAGEAVARAVALSEEISAGKCCYLCPPWSWPSVWSAVAVELFREQPEPCHLHELARHLALASTLPGAADIPDPANRAVQALRDLAASGFDNPHKLRTDERLAPLRNRQDFQDLLHRLQDQATEKPAASRVR